MSRLRQHWWRWTPWELLSFMALTLVLALVFVFGLATNEALPLAVRAACGLAAGLILVLGLGVFVAWVRGRQLRRQSSRARDGRARR